MEKLIDIIVKLSRGAVAADSLSTDEALENLDIETIAAKVEEAYKRTLSPSFKGQYITEATRKIIESLKGSFSDNEEMTTALNALKTANIDEVGAGLQGLISQKVEAAKVKKTGKEAEEAKAVADQIREAVEAANRIKDAEIAELNSKVSDYVNKEFSTAKIAAIKKALPETADLNERQMRMLVREIDAEVDFVKKGDTFDLNAKGTDSPYMGDDKQIVELGGLVASTLKDAGLWSERPPIERGGKSEITPTITEGMTPQEIKAAKVEAEFEQIRKENS